MSGRHEHTPRKFGVRWLAGPVALLVAAAAFLIGAPAGASTTVNAQLSLSGVATKTSVLGGTQIGVHPGDTVDFKASAVPTAGLDNIPALGSLLNGLLGSLTGAQFQVEATFAGNVPGVGGKTVTLGGPKSGKCAGKSEQPVTFPKKGTYHFTWTVSSVLTGLLGCDPRNILSGSTKLNQLKQAGVEFNAENEYVGEIVVADNPPKGGISIQLPSVKAHPKVGGIQLPEVNVPGAALPTIKVPDVPNLNPGHGKPGGGKSTGASSTAPDPGLTYVPPGVSVPEQVVPQGAGGGGGGAGAYNGLLPGGSSQLGNLALPARSGNDADANPAAKGAQSQGKKGTVDLASQTAKPSSQLPVVLAIIAIIALALVAGTYARLFLLRKN